MDSIQPNASWFMQLAYYLFSDAIYSVLAPVTDEGCESR